MSVAKPWFAPVSLVRIRCCRADRVRARVSGEAGRQSVVVATVHAAPMVLTTDDARGYIARVRWQFAKTMPQWPHEYTVREWRPDLEPDFLGFAALIRGEGAVKPWPRDAAHPRYHHTYLELDGWEYWTMGAPLPATTVINRARIDQSSA